MRKGLLISEFDLVVKYRPFSELEYILNNKEKMSWIDLGELKEYLRENAEKMDYKAVTIIESYIDLSESQWENDGSDYWYYDGECELDYSFPHWGEEVDEEHIGLM